MLFYRILYGLAIQKSEYLDVPLSILVAYVQPELIELVRRSLLRIKPYVAFFGLAELRPVSLLHERAGESECIGFPEHPADEFHSRRDVAPLVASAQLQANALVLIKPQVIVALKQLVAEFSERHALTRIVRETLLHRILGHHVVDGDMFADIPDEVQECVILHPVVVVHKLSLIRSVRIEIQDLRKLLANALDVMMQSLLVQQFPLLGLHRRIPDHSGRAPYDGERLVPATLEVFQYHYAHKVADVQRIRRRVYSDICRLWAFHKFLFRSRHDVLNHAPPF